MAFTGQRNNGFRPHSRRRDLRSGEVRVRLPVSGQLVRHRRTQLVQRLHAIQNDGPGPTQLRVGRAICGPGVWVGERRTEPCQNSAEKNIPIFGRQVRQNASFRVLQADGSRAQGRAFLAAVLGRQRRRRPVRQVVKLGEADGNECDHVLALFRRKFMIAIPPDQSVRYRTDLVDPNQRSVGSGNTSSLLTASGLSQSRGTPCHHATRFVRKSINAPRPQTTSVPYRRCIRRGKTSFLQRCHRRITSVCCRT